MSDARAPRVSVVLPALNAARFLPFSVPSVLRQTYRDFELVIVDDGSTDETGAVARSFDGPVRVIKGPAAGLSRARNCGVEAARGALISFLDADDAWHPEMLESQVTAMDGPYRPGLVCANCWNTDGVRLLPVRRTVQRTAHSGSVFRELLRQNFVVTSTACVRRDVLREVGRFDETLNISEDFDMWLRIARRFPVRFIDRPLAWYRVSEKGAFSDLDQRLVARERIFNKVLRETEQALLPSERDFRRIQSYEMVHVGRIHLRNGNRRVARTLFWAALRTGGSRLGALSLILLTHVPYVTFRRARFWLGTGPERFHLEVLRAAPPGGGI